MAIAKGRAGISFLVGKRPSAPCPLLGPQPWRLDRMVPSSGPHICPHGRSTHPGMPPASILLATVTSVDHTSYCQRFCPRTPPSTVPVCTPTRMSTPVLVFSRTYLTGTHREGVLGHDLQEVARCPFLQGVLQELSFPPGGKGRTSTSLQLSACI
jgi:hypothetical protein